MAGFPNYGIPGLIAGQGNQLANILGSIDPFKAYQEGQQFRVQQELQSGLPRGPDGSVDFAKAADLLARSGQMGPAIQVAQAAQQQRMGQQAAQQFAGMFGAAPQQGMPQGAPQGQPAPQQGMPSPQGGGNFGAAIAGIESGGRYDAMGPPTRNGDRAYGKYQVMGNNVGPWTQEVLGRKMSPQEFLASPEAQEKVFQSKFGGYVQKYGPEGAARAWFAGEGGMNDPNRKDVLGTSVAQYAQKFNRAMGTPSDPAPEGAAGYAPWPQMAGQTQAAPQGAPAQQAAPQAATGGRMPSIQQLVAISSNPYLPKPQQEIAKEMLKTKLDESKMTDEQKQFVFAKANGDPEAQGSFTEWKRANKSAGASKQNVTVGGGRFGTIPPGYELIEGPNGAQMRPIPGGPAAKEAEEKAAKEARGQAATKRTAQNVMEAITGVEKLVGGSNLPVTGAPGSILARLPGTAAHDASKLLDTVKSNIGFNTLNEMRANSPTGGALGSVTERELALLQSTVANLEQSQSSDQFKANLEIVKNQFLDVIHGPGKRPQGAGGSPSVPAPPPGFQLVR
jgi:hypothetical protein